MAVKIGSLWADVMYQSLDKNEKLLYIYLAAHKTINMIGASLLNLQIMTVELGLTLEELRTATITLIKRGYILTQNTPEGVYFVVLHHYHTLPKTENAATQGQKLLSSLPQPLQAKVGGKIDLGERILTFIEPTEEEVSNYALSQGYIVNAREFIQFYRDEAARCGKKGWCDSKGKPVRDWKAKMQKVWFRKATKLEAGKGAPKGFEYFYINTDAGMIMATSWRNGLPYSSEGFAYDKLLQEEYVRKKNS